MYSSIGIGKHEMRPVNTYRPYDIDEVIYANQPMAKPMRKAMLANKILKTVRTNHTTTKCQKRIGMRVANMHGMLPEKNNTLLMLVTAAM